jgi:DNA-binding NarL/FixJ family response regulator
MARVLALEVELIADESRLRRRLAQLPAPAGAVLVVDLTSADLDGASLVQALSAAGELAGMRTLAFFSHVDADTRARAERAGFDVVVPRSRMAREGAALVARLASD